MVCVKQPDNSGKVCEYSKQEPFGFQVSPADPSMYLRRMSLGYALL